MDETSCKLLVKGTTHHLNNADLCLHNYFGFMFGPLE